MTATRYLVIDREGTVRERTLAQQINPVTTAREIYEGQYGAVAKVLALVEVKPVASRDVFEGWDASEDIAHAILMEHPELATSDDLRDVNVIQFIEASIPGWFSRTAA